VKPLKVTYITLLHPPPASDTSKILATLEAGSARAYFLKRLTSLAKPPPNDAISSYEKKIFDLQPKYAVLLSTVEHLQNEALLKGIDEWYGTRYVYELRKWY